VLVFSTSKKKHYITLKPSIMKTITLETIIKYTYTVSLFVVGVLCLIHAIINPV
jgi:hypothetical protein